MPQSPKVARPARYERYDDDDAPPYPRPYPGPPPVKEGGGGRGFLYVLMLIVVVAFGGAVWNLYGGEAPPHIAAPDGAYKIQPPPDAQNAPEPPEQNAMYDNLDGHDDTPAATPVTTAHTAPEAPLANAPQAVAATAPAGPPQVSAAPAFAANGPFVAQVAALQSEEAVQPAWRRLSSRAPQLFGAAHLDVERADLGQHGVYFRVRAGYFADRANANRFCDRIKQMGQDCIVVAR